MGRRLRGAVAAARPERAPGGHRRRRAGPAAAPRPRRRRRRAGPRAPGRRASTPTTWCAALVEFGYRREELVEHRGEVARRGAIIDVFPSTADAPMRIDLWGDEVDRLTEFSVNDQRSHRRPRRGRASSRPASCCPTTRCAPGRASWSPPSRGAASSGSASPRAPLFDGMESWLPWLATERARCSPTCCRRDAKVVLVEPRRMRDRAADLLAEEDDLARTLAVDLGPGRRPRVPPPARRARPAAGRAPAAFWSIDSAPESPDDADGRGARLGPGRRRRRRPRHPAARRCCADGYRVVVAADGAGSADRLHELLRDRGLDLPHGRRRRSSTSPSPGGHIVVAPLHRGVTARRQAGGDRRGRPHRPPPRPPRARPRPRDSGRRLRGPQARQLRRPLPARRRPLRGHGAAGPSAASSATTCCSRTRAATSCTCRRDQIDALRQYVGGEAPTLHRLGGADFAKAKSRVRSAVREIAQELVVLYQKRVHAQGFAFGADTPWQTEMEDAFPFVETPDQRTAIVDVKADMERAYPMDRLVCGDVGFGKTEVAIRAAFKAIQDGKQVAVLAPTTLLATQHGNTFGDRFAGYPIRVEVLSRFLTAGAGPRGGRRAGDGRGRLRDRHPPPAVGGRRVQGPRPARGRRGAALRRAAQGGDEEAQVERRRAHAHGHADPAHAGDEPRRHPRPVAAQHAAGRPPADPHLRRRVRRAGGGRGDPPRAAARGPGVLGAQPGAARSTTRPPALRELVPEARIAVAHGQMDEGTLEQVVVDFWEGQYDVLVCTTIIESRHRHADGEHARRRARRPARPRSAAPAARPGRPQRPARLRLPVPPRRRGPHRGGLRAAADDRRGHRARQRVQDRHARPRDPRRRQPARRGAERPHRRRRLRPLLPDGDRGGGRDEGRDAGRAGRDQARRADRRLPARRLRGEGGAAARGLPPAGRRHHVDRGRRHPRRVGGPLRAGARAGRGAARGSPGCVPSATASASATSRSPATRPGSPRCR